MLGLHKRLVAEKEGLFHEEKDAVSKKLGRIRYRLQRESMIFH